MNVSRILFVGLFLAFVAGALPLIAVQEVKEVVLVGKILNENTQDCSKVMKEAFRMREQAVPFLKPHYRERIRFHPSDVHTREILSVTRSLRSRFKLLSGVLYHVPIKNRETMFKNTETSLETLTNSSKRALRAIRDGNFELYLASAETASREAQNLFNLTIDFENLINQSIEKADLSHENL